MASPYAGVIEYSSISIMQYMNIGLFTNQNIQSSQNTASLSSPTSSRRLYRQVSQCIIFVHAHGTSHDVYLIFKKGESRLRSRNRQ